MGGPLSVATVLTHSFRFLPSVGPATEEKLWKRGILTWADFLATPAIPRIPEKRKDEHDRILDHAGHALAKGDAGFFARRLPSDEAWRCVGHFDERAVYLDIETDPADGVTVIGMAMPGRESVALVQGDDLSPESVEAYIGDASMLVTFNGASFDLPMMRRFGFPVPSVPHLDLRLALRRLDLTGGLKKIEKNLGLARDDDLDGVDGWEAVRLWRRHAGGDPTALDKLVRYNLADVENLIPLTAYAYTHLKSRQLGKFPRQAHLPVAP